MSVNGVELVIFIVLFVARQRRSASSPPAGAGPTTMEHLDEWGLGGRNFGPLGHLVPARRRPLHRVHVRRRSGAGVRRRRRSASSPMPYTIVVYPIVFLVLIRLWSVSPRARLRHPGRLRPRRGFGSSTLALLVAITGIVATMPYIALQLVGIEAVLKTMGVTGTLADHRRVRDPRGLHLQLRPARSGAHRVRQGRADLPRDHRRRDLHPGQARRLGVDLRRRGREVHQVPEPRRRHPARRAASCSTRRWRSARRWRCSSTRTR